MTLYLLKTCDRNGHVLHHKRVTAPDAFAALASANRRLRVMIRVGMLAMDPKGRIDVTDQRGHTVARLVCAEAIAAMS
jgi:hypothetical protein